MKKTDKKTTKTDNTELDENDVAQWENPTEAETVELIQSDTAAASSTSQTEREGNAVIFTNEQTEAEIISDENAEITSEDKAEIVSAEATVAATKIEVDEKPLAAKTAVAASSPSAAGSAMSGSTKGLIVLLFIALLGGGLLFWKSKVTAAHGPIASFDRISKEEMELLLKDANPMMLKQLENPEARKQQLDGLKEMLALASAAKKEGLVNKETVKNELQNIRTQLTAVNYDQEINKDKGQMPPFSFIKEDRVKEFWGEGSEPGFLDKLGVGPKYRREAEFKKFLDTKLELAKEAKQIKDDYQLKDEELKQAKEFFAKTRIYADEAHEKEKALGDEFKRKLELMVKLQQAQFLSRLYAKKLVDKTAVTDADIDKYLQEHPELAPSPEKKAKAEDVLRRVKAGEDFAALAKEFSEDPGSKDKGGLYENVAKDSGFDKNFENTALALEPGQIAENLVETPFGYHIIKLENKGTAPDPQTGQEKQTYNVRHILISTAMKDPDNPFAREVSGKEIARAKLEQEKEKKILDELKASNPVEIAEDFEIPKVSEEQMQEMMQQQMQQQQMQMPQGEDMPQMEAPESKDTKKPQPKKTK